MGEVLKAMVNISLVEREYCKKINDTFKGFGYEPIWPEENVATTSILY